MLPKLLFLRYSAAHTLRTFLLVEESQGGLDNHGSLPRQRITIKAASFRLPSFVNSGKNADSPCSNRTGRSRILPLIKASQAVRLIN
jgi:hypothetical protein